VLSASVHYACDEAGPLGPISGTIEIANGCIQEISHLGQQAITASGDITTSGNEVLAASSCVADSGNVQTFVPTSTTFTATATSLTVFYPSPFSQYTVFTRVSSPPSSSDASQSSQDVGSATPDSVTPRSP
jgi:hypothetical protein